MNLLEKNSYGEVDKSKKYWLIRAGVESNYSSDFEINSFIALGWDRIDTKNITKNKDNFRALVENLYPEINEQKDEKTGKNSKRKITDISRKIFTFYNELQIGDIVITPTSDNSVLIGEITGDVEIIESGIFPINNEKDKFGNLIGSLNKKRRIKWMRKINRVSLEANLKNHIRTYSGISHIKDEQVITEINRELYSVYIKGDKTHAIFYARETGDIDGYKYAVFIEKMTKLIKIVENTSGDKINFSIKSNIQSPGPLELIFPNGITNCIINGMNYILKKQSDAIDNIENPEIKEKIKELAKDVDCSYDDYEFPCSGNY